MKNTGLFAILISIALLNATPGWAQNQSRLKTEKEKQSYAMGVEMLRNLQRQGFDFDLDALFKGMKDGAAGDKLALNDDEMLASLNFSASQARVKRTSEQLLTGLDNRKAEEEFVTRNQGKEGVVTLPSGLQYKIIRGGMGKKPSAGDTVEVNYRGTLLDGTVFESTYEAGHPATIKVSDAHVIAGLREALKLMPAGASWEIYVPSRLAYGQRPAGKNIGPYSMLVYQLELLGTASAGN
jgi:FKBP-type peptidyl-prolyl cis-trans isomerase